MRVVLCLQREGAEFCLLSIEEMIEHMATADVRMLSRLTSRDALRRNVNCIDSTHVLRADVCADSLLRRGVKSPQQARAAWPYDSGARRFMRSAIQPGRSLRCYRA